MARRHTVERERLRMHLLVRELRLYTHALLRTSVERSTQWLAGPRLGPALPGLSAAAPRRAARVFVRAAAGAPLRSILHATRAGRATLPFVRAPRLATVRPDLLAAAGAAPAAPGLRLHERLERAVTSAARRLRAGTGIAALGAPLRRHRTSSAAAPAAPASRHVGVPALIWPRPAASPARAIESSIETIPVRRSSTRSEQSNEIHSALGVGRGARPEQAAAAAVDARLLERVTEDVLRRVDKRLRVERERRGM
jgi:hypothetical protein